MTDDHYLQLRMISSWYYNYRYYATDEFIKTYTTGISQELLTNIKKKIADPVNTKLKYLMFSGHDDNVFAFMRAYNLTNDQCMRQRYINHVDPKGDTGVNDDASCLFLPGFAASLLWELSEKSGKYYVRSLYNGVPVKFCQENEDEFYCLMDNFEKTVKEKMIRDVDIPTYCKGSQNGGGDSGKGTGAIWKILTLVLSFLVIILAIALIVIKNSKENASKNSSEYNMQNDEEMGLSGAK